jgi:hypothetical protein
VKATHFLWRGLALLVAMVATLLAVGAPPAAAEYLDRGRIHAFVNEDGVLVEQPRRVAVEQSTGNAFVVEEVTGRVLVFKPSGLSAEPLTEFGSGVLDAPFGIAISESGGLTSIYVSDAGTNSIVRFLSDGAATPTFTVDATYASPAQGTEADEVQSFASPLALAPDGDLWVADRGADVVKRFDSTGAHVAGSNFNGSTSPEGAFTGLLDIAANSEGDLYLVDATGEISKSEGTSRVQRFAETGAYKATLGPLGPESRSATVAVNPGDDKVAISGDQDGINRGVFQPLVYLFDAANAPIEEIILPETVQGGSSRGMAFHDTTRNPLYIAVGRNWYLSEGVWGEFAGSPGVGVMSEAIPPVLTIDPASGVTGVAATISGEINSQGVPSTWQVEYRRAGATAWESTGERSAGAGSAPVAISETLEGLAPGQQYEARLQAESADGSSASSIVTFTTDPTAPRVVNQSVSVAGDAATLRARIEPGGAETTYHFEYGPTASYGQTTPEGTIPAGSVGVNVAALIDGLTPGATYHFRVVVENAEGADSGEDRSFTVPIGADSCPNAQYRGGNEALLADCRAYELVTPAGAEADIRVGGAPTTPDGRTVCFNTEDTLAGSDPNGIKLADDGFCAGRGADGWQTTWVTGPTPSERHSGLGGNVYFLSPDGNRAVFASDNFIFRRDYISVAPSAGTQMRSYMWENGQTRELSPPPPPIVIPGFGEFFPPENASSAKRPLAASEDATRGIFQSGNNLVPEDTNFAMDVYEWNPDGLRIVSTVDGSSEAAGGAAPLAYDRQVAGTGIVSADGGRIFFHHEGAPLDADAEPAEAPEALQSVYMREGDEVTLVTPRDGSNADQSFRFAAASSDGERVYVESLEEVDQYTDKAGDVYVYDVSSGELDLFASRPGGTEVLGVSEDGSTVVFRSLGSFQAFVVRGGTTTLLGTLAPTERSFVGQEEDTAFRLGSHRPDQRALRFTPDGSSLVFTAAGEFAGSTAGVPQVYRWSAEDGLQNISDAGGSPPTKPASIGAYSTQEAGTSREEYLAEHRYKPLEGRVLTDDGSRVFFETPEGLVDGDVNGVVDVYEWHEGDVALVTPGTGTGKALYHDSSADGKTVFFTTFDRIDPERDTNNNRDLYVAQPGGGYPALPVQPSCEGEACQPGRLAPAVGGPGNDGVAEGNVGAAPRIKSLGKKQLKQLASGGRTTVPIAVTEPGRVTALLKGKINGRSATVARASKTASKAGTVRLTLKLSKPALTQLGKRGTLRLTLVVTHSRSDQTARRGVMLRD